MLQLSFLVLDTSSEENNDSYMEDDFGSSEVNAYDRNNLVDFGCSFFMKKSSRKNLKFKRSGHRNLIFGR